MEVARILSGLGAHHPALAAYKARVDSFSLFKLVAEDAAVRKRLRKACLSALDRMLYRRAPFEP